ncbi:hypothetical protein GJ496_004833 [Pomphorhynchus laevis]|nr:hypothetical protein GJ496_004833 [Pomphorhynchus laevis]
MERNSGISNVTSNFQSKENKMYNKFQIYLFACSLIGIANCNSVNLRIDQLHAGDNVILQAQTLKSGQFRFAWYHNEVEITNDTNYKISSFDNLSKLTIMSFGAPVLTPVTYKVIATHDTETYTSTFMLVSGDIIVGFNTSRASEVIRQSVTRNEGDKLSLTCRIHENITKENGNQITWKFRSDQMDEFDILKNVSFSTKSIHNDTIIFDKLLKSNRGMLQCIFQNASKDVYLRIKDKYAVLWPFLGIIIEVVLLIFIIVFFERRQKKNKMSAGADEDANLQSETLMKKNTNLDDGGEVKKRMVMSTK